MRRKRIRRRLFWWHDRYTDWLCEAASDRVYDWLDLRWLARLACSALTHEPIHDDCGNPEHDLCAWCQKGMPFQAANVARRAEVRGLALP